MQNIDELTIARQSVAQLERMQRDAARLPELEAEAKKRSELAQARTDLDRALANLEDLAGIYKTQREEVEQRLAIAQREAQVALDTIAKLIQIWENQCKPVARAAGYNQCKLGLVPWPNTGPITDDDVKRTAQENLKRAGIDSNVEEYKRKRQTVRLVTLLD